MKKTLFALGAAMLMVCILAGCGNSEPVGVVRIPIPEGFEQDSLDGLTEYYICEDSSNITMYKGEPDPTIEIVTQDYLLERLNQAYGAYSSDIDVTITPVSFSSDKIAGCPGYKFIFEFEMEETKITQYQFTAQSDKMYTWTMTDMTGEHAEDFENCLDNIYLEK